MTCCAAHTMSVRAPLKPPQGKEHWSMLSSGKGERGRFVDGGVVANNPTIAGISFLQRIYPGSNMTNTAVLSLGCGSCWSSSGLPTAGGQLGAAGPMVEIMMGANCDTAAAAGEMLYRTVSIATSAQLVAGLSALLWRETWASTSAQLDMWTGLVGVDFGAVESLPVCPGCRGGPVLLPL